MSVRGNSVFHASVAGFCEQLEKGLINVIAVPVPHVRTEADGTQKTFITKLYALYELIKGIRKDIYIISPNTLLRPMVLHNASCVVQNWDCPSITTESPTKDDLEVYAYDRLMNLLSEIVAKAADVDPDVYPCKYTSQSRDTGSENAWMETPSNNRLSKFPWNFEDWQKSEGVATFRIKSGLVQAASMDARGEHRDNYIAIKLALGRQKFNVNEKAKQIAVRRTIEEVQATSAPAPKKLKPSKEALAALNSAPVEPVNI